jgi:cell division protein FtsN
VEPQTPAGPKSPYPPSSSSKQDTVWISPRLREKLGDPEEGPPKDGPPPWIGLVLALLVIGGGLGLFMTIRGSAAKEKVAAAERARLAAAAATAESIATAARADSMRARADSVAAATPSSAVQKPGAKPAGSAPPVAANRPTPPAGTSTPAGAGATTPPAPPKVVEKGPFGLDVGTFLVEERASSEQARLSEATGLPGKVVTRNEDGGDAYHVVLGSFATRAAAEKRAEALVAKGQVNQARPVSLAP